MDTNKNVIISDNNTTEINRVYILGESIRKHVIDCDVFDPTNVNARSHMCYLKPKRLCKTYTRFVYKKKNL